MRSLAAVLFLLLACAFTAGCASSGGTRFLAVIPQQMPDGSSAEEEREAFEAWLLDRAGGYTDLGTGRGAWRSPEGKVYTEDNRLYMISVGRAPRRFHREIRERIVEDFDQEEAYVERW